MIKIKLCERNKHRNETTFRPLVFIYNELKEAGIELVTDATSYDYAIVGQASIADKNLPLQESVDNGLSFLEGVTGDYFIVDGQDATTLIGTGDVLRHVYKDDRCKLFLKSSYLTDFDLYKEKWKLGRIYWGEGDYSVPDIDDMKHKMKLIGFNWLSTMNPTWHDVSKQKPNDVWAYFQYPLSKKHYEHGELQSIYYENFRKGLHDKLEKIEHNYSVIRMTDGKKIPHDKYYQTMYDSKLILSPFGFGEMAPRDIETAMFGAILLKNDMSYINTVPNPYIKDETYISMKWDWSDLEEKIEYVITNFDELQDKFINNLKTEFLKRNNKMDRVIYFYNIIKNLEGVIAE